MARKAVAIPIELAKNVRRGRLSFLARSSAISPISRSTCFCCLFCGRGMNSSFDTTCVGTGESTPSFRSRCHLGIHIDHSFAGGRSHRCKLGQCIPAHYPLQVLPASPNIHT